MAEGRSEPVEAVRALIGHLHENDMAGFAKAALPPEDYVLLQQAWREGRDFWPLTELPLDGQLLPLLANLAAPGAEQRLRRSFDTQFLGEADELKSAVRTMGIFGTQYLRYASDLDTQQRQHHLQIMRAVSEWGVQAPLADPALAYAGIQRLSAAAREVGLYSQADLEQAGLEQSLRKLSPFFAEIQQVLADYGLDLRGAYDALQLSLIERRGDTARVRVRYPLAARTIETTFAMRHINGVWYLEGYLQRVGHVATIAGEESEMNPSSQIAPLSADSESLASGRR